MNPTLFISDLHLCPGRLASNQLFFDFLEGPARSAGALYILGDLFEYWAGDDDLDDPFNDAVTSALGRLAAQGVGLYVMHGNRDFLLGAAFARLRAKSCPSQPGPRLRDATLLMHGDTCVPVTRVPGVSRPGRDRPGGMYFGETLEERKAMIGQLRASEQEKGVKPRNHGRHFRRGGSELRGMASA